MGPESDTVPYQDLADRGAGRVPGYKWQYNGHSNQLVPLYARGLGANLFLTCANQREVIRTAMVAASAAGLISIRPRYSL